MLARVFALLSLMNRYIGQNLKASMLILVKTRHQQLFPLISELIRQQSFNIARNFGLLWTAIDWLLDPTGEYVFL